MSGASNTSNQSRLQLSSSVRDLPGVGAAKAKAFARLEIATISDLIRHLPMRYEHEQAEDIIARLPRDGVGAARGRVTAVRWVASRGGRVKGRFEIGLEDDSGAMNVVWFNASYLIGKLHPGMTIRVQGKVRSFDGYPQMVNPKWEDLTTNEEAEEKSEMLRPIYPATEELSSARIELVVAAALPIIVPALEEPLPEELLRHHNMPVLSDAFRMAHAPAHEEEAAAARRRLAFNELLLIQLGIALKRHYNETVLHAPALRWSEAIDEHIRGRFPFALTQSQNVVVEEIVRDLQKSYPMNRLLQGDVGAGKTVVALYAMLMAVADQKQAALMAPTELLAEQHMRSIAQMLEGSNVRIALLTGGRSTSASARKSMLEQIATGDMDIVIGTQALLTETVDFNDLAVVVIDEQHRFGVAQRAKLRSRSSASDVATKQMPHCLVMTATPIPRSLSLTVFGDLDVSIIKGLPPGRTPVATRIMPSHRSDEVYNYLAERLRRGEQAYVVLPAIDTNEGDEADGTPGGRLALRNVTDHVKLLRQRYCRDFVVEAVHGRLDRDERESMMQRFRDGAIDVLVATTVIEVGVDVANASVMVVEHAERFGLAQLHQLRGRVGRGSDGVQALCVFIADPTTPDAESRIAAIAETTDGFEIAEADLKIRGMGDFFGTRQSGSLPLRVARIPDDIELLKLARKDANELIAEDPKLARPQHQLLRKVLLQQHGDAIGLVDVG